MQCRRTARAVARALDLAPWRWASTFQSRFGKEVWLTPYTDETLEAWGKERLSSVDVVCPGFSADCLETTDEIGREAREEFEGAGGGRYRYVPALNTRTDHIGALVALLKKRLES